MAAAAGSSKKRSRTAFCKTRAYHPLSAYSSQLCYRDAQEAVICGEKQVVCVSADWVKGLRLASSRLAFCISLSADVLGSKYRPQSTYVGRRLRRPLPDRMLAILPLELISASIHGKIAATPRRCTYLGRAEPGDRVGVFDCCSNISTHPLGDLRHREQSMKPSRSANSRLHHNVLESAEERGGGVHLRAMLFCCRCGCCCCLPVCQHIGISTSPRPHSKVDDGGADSSACGMHKESGQRDGYVRGCVFVVEEEKIRSALEKQTTLPRRRCATSSATILISRSGCR